MIIYPKIKIIITIKGIEILNLLKIKIIIII